MDTALDASRCALLCMDFQRDIIGDSALAPSDEEARGRFERAIERTALLLERSRDRGVLVVHVRIVFSEGYPEASPHAPMGAFMRAHGALIEGTPGAAFDPRVAPREGEAVITKRGVSAFVGTELDRLLRVRGVDTPIATGLVTHYVVEGTARHASDLGYRVLVPSDCCASGGVDRHEMALVNLRPLAEVVTADAVEAALG